MTLELRPAEPSEVSIAVPLIYSSGPDAFEYVFKNTKASAADFLTYAFVKEGGEFSYDNHQSLYVDGKMVGIGSVFDAKRAATFTKADGLNILRFYGLKSGGVIKRGLQTERIIKPPTANEIVLAHLAIQPQHRGKSYGTRMITALMKKTNASTSQPFILDVSEENPKAKALYDRLGFKVIKKKSSTLKNAFSYVPNHFRMALR